MNTKRMALFEELKRAIADVKTATTNYRIAKILSPVSAKYEKEHSYLYFIQCDDVIKIGVAKDVENRLAMLQTGCPRKLTLVFKKENFGRNEVEIHKKFSHLRCHGEWFYLVPEILSFIEELKNA